MDLAKVKLDDFDQRMIELPKKILASASLKKVIGEYMLMFPPYGVPTLLDKVCYPAFEKLIIPHAKNLIKGSEVIQLPESWELFLHPQAAKFCGSDRIIFYKDGRITIGKKEYEYTYNERNNCMIDTGDIKLDQIIGRSLSSEMDRKTFFWIIAIHGVETILFPKLVYIYRTTNRDGGRETRKYTGAIRFNSGDFLSSPEKQCFVIESGGDFEYEEGEDFLEFKTITLL